MDLTTGLGAVPAWPAQAGVVLIAVPLAAAVGLVLDRVIAAWAAPADRT